MSPKVSICIPAYRRPASLLRAVESVLAQSYDNYEVIITDDSPDDSVETALGLYKSDDRIKYYKNTATLGSPENWNEAIDKASGEYIKILHHDDWFYDENSLFEFVAMLDNDQSADFAFCSSSACDSEGHFKFVHTPSNYQLGLLRNSYKNVFPYNFIGSPSATIFRRTQKKFDHKLKWVVDMDFYMNLLRDNSGFVFNSKTLVNIDAGEENKVTTVCLADKNLQIYEWIYLYRKYWPGAEFNLKILWFFCKLFNKCKVRTIDNILGAAVVPPIPIVARLALKINRIGLNLRKLK
ncbi:MAG: hypothetical protein A2076_05675 [Geobacteraceae bacterium GWC2_53_11]|nr:MAG: hypothetical protein A2076_05675 [Geobacteraceae bacterium GWC2_53_11]